MENLKEYIEKRIPEAVEEGGEILTLKVEPGAFRELAVQLRNCLLYTSDAADE